MEDPKLIESLKALYQSLREQTLSKWNRDLPFDELMFDRWERASALGFGEKSSVYHNSYVFGNVKVGANTWVGPFTLLDGTGGLSIGDYCSISAGVHIYSHNTVKWAVSGGKMPYEHAEVVIEDCCFIGPQSIVSAGVRIGKHSVVAANSFVNKDLPPFSIAAGNPAIIIGEVILDENSQVSFSYFNKEHKD
ncbi:MAG: acyltransferase [Bacteroidota bacterium]